MDNNQSSNFWSTPNMVNTDVQDSFFIPNQTTVSLNETTENMGLEDFQNPFQLPNQSTTPIELSGVGNLLRTNFQDSTELPPLPESFSSMDLLMDQYLPTLPSFLETDNIFQDSYNLYSLFDENNVQPPQQPQLLSEDDRGKGKMVMEPPQPQLLSEKDKGKDKMMMEEEGSTCKKCKKISNSTSRSIVKAMDKQTISQYFYLPIKQAAKELNVGVTLLKQRCRALGINKWPNRKLQSIQNLINNVQKLGEESVEDETKLQNIIEELEREKKLLEESPNTEIQDSTIKLRQICFKTKFKKKRPLDGENNAEDLELIYREFNQDLSDRYQ